MFAVYAARPEADDPLAALTVGERPDPDVPAGSLAVTVRAASLNMHDLWTLRGVGIKPAQFPMILGCDGAGVLPDGSEVVLHSVVTSPGWMGDETLDPKRSLLTERLQGTFADTVVVPERNVLPKPYVKPHPPMWVAAGNPDTFKKAGQLGLGVLCFTGGSPERMRQAVDVYKEAIQDAEPVGEFVNDNIAISTSFMCLEDGDKARQHMTTSRNGRQQSLVFKYLDTFPKPPGIPDWPEEILDPTLEQLAIGAKKGTSIVGTPDDCAEALEKWDAIGVDQLIMGPTGSAWPYDLVEETVELFGNEVIPRFDPDPEPRSARWRREAGERLQLTAVD